MFLLAVSQTYIPLAFTGFFHKLTKSVFLHLQLSSEKKKVLFLFWRLCDFHAASPMHRNTWTQLMCRLWTELITIMH